MGVRRIRGPSPCSLSSNAPLNAANRLPHTACGTVTSIGWESRPQIGREPRVSREHRPQIYTGRAAGRVHPIDRHPPRRRDSQSYRDCESRHRAERGDKASQEGCGRFSETSPSRCRFCRPKPFLRPRRRILPLTHSESPSLVAVRRPPSRIEPLEAASVLGGGAGFRGAKRGGVCAGTNKSGDAQPVHGSVQGPEFAGFLHRPASL